MPTVTCKLQYMGKDVGTVTPSEVFFGSTQVRGKVTVKKSEVAELAYETASAAKEARGKLNHNKMTFSLAGNIIRVWSVVGQFSVEVIEPTAAP